MLTIQSGIIKENQKIDCKYYELDEKCKEITEEYCRTNKTCLEEFQEFSKDYLHFRPYFDFVVCRLGYKILNAQMEEGTTLVGKENHMYVYKNKEQQFEKNFRYGMSDDKTLDIYPMTLDSSTFHDCLIDGENNHILPKDMYGHTQILQQMLNLLLISNKEICEEFLNYTSDIGYFVQRYLPLIRFQADKQGSMIITRCVYRRMNRTKSQEMFMNDLLDNRYTYPSFLLNVEKEDNYENARDLSKDLIYKIGKIKKTLRNRKIIVVNGPENLKNIFISSIKKMLPVTSFSPTDKLEDILASNNLKDDDSEKFRQFLHNIKNLTTNYNDFTFNYILEQVISFCESKDNILFITSVDMEEIKKLKNAFGGGVYTLAIKEEYPKDTDNLDTNYPYDYLIENSTCSSLELEAQTFINQLLEKKEALKH